METLNEEFGKALFNMVKDSPYTVKHKEEVESFCNICLNYPIAVHCYRSPEKNTVSAFEINNRNGMRLLVEFVYQKTNNYRVWVSLTLGGLVFKKKFYRKEFFDLLDTTAVNYIKRIAKEI